MRYPKRCAGCDLVGYCREEDIPVCISQEAEVRGEIEAELAYERYLEDRCWQDAELERIMEQRMGVISFRDALDASAISG
jgi:hypothetical protein